MATTVDRRLCTSVLAAAAALAWAAASVLAASAVASSEETAPWIEVMAAWSTALAPVWAAVDEVAALVNRVIEMDMGRVVLDDRVADAVDVTSRMDCLIVLVRPDAAFARAIGEWGFHEAPGGLRWSGLVNGPDRLRFMCMLSRYTGLIAGLDMTEAKEAAICAPAPH